MKKLNACSWRDYRVASGRREKKRQLIFPQNIDSINAPSTYSTSKTTGPYAGLRSGSHLCVQLSKTYRLSRWYLAKYPIVSPMIPPR